MGVDAVLQRPGRKRRIGVGKDEHKPLRIERFDSKDLVGPERTADLDAMFDAERAYIAHRRRNQGLTVYDPETKPSDDMALEREIDMVRSSATALCLSGGGIRSATIGLGVLQAMAKHNLLRHVDYLSTVSGGGYIGTALTWWLSKGPYEEVGETRREHEEARQAIEAIGKNGDVGIGEKNFPFGTSGPRSEGPRDPESRKQARRLDYLRAHGNYMIPGGGIGGVALLAVVLRGWIISAALWFTPMFLLMYALAYFDMSYVVRFKAQEDFIDILQPLLAGGGIFGFLIMAITGAVMYLRRVTNIDPTRVDIWPEAVFGSAFAIGVAFIWWWYGAEPVKAEEAPDAAINGIEILLFAGGMCAVAFATVSLLYALLTPNGDPPRLRVFRPYQSRRLFEEWSNPFLTVTAFLVALGSIEYVIEGLVPSNAPKAGGGAGIGTFSILGGLFAAAGSQWDGLKSKLEGLGVKMAELPFTIMAIIASMLLLYGMTLISYDVATRLAVFMAQPEHKMAWLPFAVAFVVFIISWSMFDLNLISIHRVYRDRLMEAFMPSDAKAAAGKPGRANGDGDRFLLQDALALAPLEVVDDAELIWRRKDDQPMPRAGRLGPYPLINANVVMINAEEPRRRFRGGDSFVLSPYFCGSNATGYTLTSGFDDRHLTMATAMAISGAAANPNTGASGFGPTRQRAVSAVMTLLNLRLGLWVKHPVKEGGKRRTWPKVFDPGLRTLIPGIGVYHEDSKWQEITDGGHFAQLGLYELVRRRCRLIVCVDAGQDPDYTFNDLIIELRRIEQDFGVSCQFANEHGGSMRPCNPGGGFSAGLTLCAAPYAVGTLSYPDATKGGHGRKHHKAMSGTLIYLKSSLFEELPLEVLGYARSNPGFPHQSTADQFFDEVQFEAYRQMGWAMATRMIDDGVFTSAWGEINLNHND